MIKLPALSFHALRGRRSCDAPRRGGDAERPGIHSTRSVERGGKELTGLQNLSALVLLALLLLIGCNMPDPAAVPTLIPTAGYSSPAPLSAVSNEEATEVETAVLPPASPFPAYEGVPTPNPPRAAAAETLPSQTHTIAAGETLGYLAQVYGSSVEELQTINNLTSDLLYVGQELLIPLQASVVGPDLKLIPDSELLYSPSAKDFNTVAVVAQFNGYLAAYSEDVEGSTLSGAEIVSLVAHRYSVNPRLLLAALEYRSGWLTQSNPPDDGRPLGHYGAGGMGLYKQLSWAANQMNWGYYGRSEGGISSILLGDGTRVAFAPTINDGTAGVQSWLAAHEPPEGAGDSAAYDIWLQESGADGFFSVYGRLFGNPFAYTHEPILPADLTQPALQLPWAKGESWYFTGGPHGGWASGSAWAALDFVPPGDSLGCVQSEDWVTAVSDGVVARSDFGAVAVDMDGDGYAGTGWAILYMHLESRDRIPVGAFVQAGDPLGHPSCEGGFSDGTHLHLARSYNGRWIPADGSIPFEMSGWLSSGLGREYDGLLTRGAVVREAWTGIREEINEVKHE